eukprot:CFRG0768T1
MSWALRYAQRIVLSIADRAWQWLTLLTVHQGILGNTDIRTGLSSQVMVYHERQRLGWCAKHALNCLVQRKYFSIGALEKIAIDLHRRHGFKGRNQHKSIIPWYGNYDVNVIIEALKQVRLRIHWFDSRRDLYTDLQWNIVTGIIANVRGNGAISFSNHWICIREVDGHFYSLDSKYSRPRSFSTQREAIDFLHVCITSLKGNLLVVTDKDVDSVYVVDQSKLSL